MSRQTTGAESKPLSGVRVLVGRARHQAGALSAELRRLGARVLEIPFIEIRKPRSFKPLDRALRNLEAYDWLILTSVNGVEAMWERLERLGLLTVSGSRKGQTSGAKALGEKRGFIAALEALRHPKSGSSGNLTALGSLRIAAIGPATKKAIEQRGVKVNVVPKEYVAESVVRSLRKRVKGKRVLLVRAKVARDVIPRELRQAGAQVDVVEAYETVVPQASRTRLRSALANRRRRPHVITFTSSSSVRNFVELLDSRGKPIAGLSGVLMASIGPVTSSTLRERKLPVDIKAHEFTIPGLVAAIARALESRR